jgi:SAM-dependent methyltransferase
MSLADRQKWNLRYAGQGSCSEQPDPFLLSLDAELPRRGAALDVAGGAGRNAVWLAGRGLDVTLVDIAEAGLAQAAERAARAGVCLTTLQADLDSDPLPPGPWDLVLCCQFHWPPLFGLASSLLRPGGLLVVVQATRKNLDRHASPSERYLLDDGALPSLVRRLHIVRYEEGWTDSGRHEARLLARYS